jgi:hypothetical protein
MLNIWASIIFLLLIVLRVDGLKHVYTSHKKHIDSIKGARNHFEYHGLSKSNEIIFSSRLPLEEKHHKNFTRLRIKRHSKKIVSKLDKTVVIKTTHSPEEIYNDLRPWLPLLHNVTFFREGLVLTSHIRLPWYLLSMIEGHESVLTMAALQTRVFKPTLIHGAKALIKECRVHVHTDCSRLINYEWTDDVITVADSGIDVHHCAFKGSGTVDKYIYNGVNAESILNDLNAAKDRKKIVGYLRLGISNLMETDFEDPIESGGHGTHVAGIVAGGECLGRVNNMKILVFDLMRSGEDFLHIPPFFTDLLRISYESGSRVMTNSWGGLEEGREYSSLTREMDEFLLEHDDYMIIQASGNDGDKGVNSPGVFKNGITVGASMNSYASWKENYPYDPFVLTRPEIFNEENLFTFSSWGEPGGRRKPNLVAPGGAIRSARSGGGQMLLYGSSMSSPLVAWKYMAIKAQLPKNLSALVPYGIMLASSEALKGYFVEYSPLGSVRHGKVNSKGDGWGLAVSNVNPKNWAWIDRVTMSQGVREWCFESKQKGRNQTVVLLWRDLANWPGSKGELVMDYDLRVVLEGVKEKKEIITLSDHRNNIEKVSWRSMKHERVRVQVSVESDPVDYHIPMKFTLVYSKGLKPVECGFKQKGQECDDEETPAWKCEGGGVRICRNGKWGSQCYQSKRVGEFNQSVSDWGCYMSTSEFDCVSGREVPWVPEHKARVLSTPWSVSDVMVGAQDMVEYDTFVWVVCVAIAVPIWLVWLQWLIIERRG